MKVHITIDAREKTPLPLPATLEMADFSVLPQHQRTRRVFITTSRATIKTADYLLAGEPGVVYTPGDCCVVETKRSLSEIAANVLNPHKRGLFVALLQRMAAHRRAFLVVEGGLKTLTHKRGVGDDPFNPAVALDQFLALCLQWGVHPWLIDGSSPEARLRTGEFVARLLILGKEHGRQEPRAESAPAPGGPAYTAAGDLCSVRPAE
jgi:hypothetical protein